MSVPAAPTEPAPALGVLPPLAPERGRRQRRTVAADPLGVWRELWWPTLAIAAIFCFITFYAKGGLNLESMTTTEMTLTLGAGVVVAAAVILAPSDTPTYGLWPIGLLLAFTILTGLSVAWSVQPNDSWQDSGRMLAYSGVFGASVALVRVIPGHWPAVLGGLTLAAVVVCGYALLTKIFPGSLAPSNTYARLEEPYGYWNAIGLTAAMGSICCLWLGARRTGHALLRALAYPAMGVLLLTLVLAYSRGALAALLVGLVLWFGLVPLRLRGAALLIVGTLGAGAIAAWDFSTSALSSEGVSLAQRTAAGHQLGVLVVAMLLALAIAGVAIGFFSGRQPPSQLARVRAGAALLAAIAVVMIAFAGALAHSHRGLTGSVSHAFNALTDPNAKPPPNTPDRLTAVASVRARYWKEALQTFDAHPALGVGAGGYATARLRYRQETLEVRHAHGFAVQTLADLGLVGLTLALTLALTWMAAAGRATHPFNRRWTSWGTWLQIRSGGRPGWRRLREPKLTRYTPERIGLLSMLCVVAVFGVHSLDRLDVVRAWRRMRGAAVRGLARRSRAAEDRGGGRAIAIDRRRAGAGGGLPLAARLGGATERPAPAPRRRRDRRGVARRMVAVAAAALRRRPPAGGYAARSARPARRERGGEQRGRTRPAVGASAVHPRQRPAGLRSPRARPRDARASGAPAALKPADVAGAGTLRPRQRSSSGPEGAPSSDLSQPRVDRARSDRERRARSDRNPQRLHPRVADSCAAGRGLQKRERIAHASRSRRAPGRPRALCTLISSKPKSPIRRVSVWRL